ncbi:MAG: choice-of-anchor Q domain-containing protein [Candidatus Hydrogenedentota bacterium]
MRANTSLLMMRFRGIIDSSRRAVFHRLLSLLVCIVLLLLTPSAFAAIVYVDIDNTSGSKNGSTWSTAYTSIQTAIDNANPGDEIWVAQGVYEEMVIPVSDLEMYGGFIGSESILAARDLSIHITEARGLSVDGTTNLTVDGFRFRRDFAYPAGIATDVFSCDASNVIQNCTFLTSISVSGSPQFHRSTFTGPNRVINLGVSPDIGPTFESCTFSSNEHWGAWNDTLLVSTDGSLTVINCLFSGGNWETSFINNDSDVLFSNCVFEHGGIRGQSGTIVIRNSIFSESSDVAIREHFGRENISLENCLFYNNLLGDYYDIEEDRYLRGPAELNALPHASGNVSGNPHFVRYDSGSWTSPSIKTSADGFYNVVNVLTDSTASFIPGSLVGKFVLPKRDYTYYLRVDTSFSVGALIIENTETTLTVASNFNFIDYNLPGSPTFVDRYPPHLESMLFVDAPRVSAGDRYEIYDLRPGQRSMAIDRGSNNGAPSLDFEGNARPFGNSVDIGAFEWGMGDSDQDGIVDSLDEDDDNDGVTDVDEIAIYGSNPNDPDTDDDGLWDGIEQAIGTSLIDSDSDGDGFTDGFEIEIGKNPRNSASKLDRLYVSVGGTGRGTSWQDAMPYIGTAMRLSSSARVPVWVSSGNYNEVVDFLSHARLYGGFRGDETRFMERDTEENIATIDSLDFSRVNVVMRDVIGATLDGFHLTGTLTGQLSSSHDRKSFGFIAFDSDSSNSVLNCRFSGELDVALAAFGSAPKINTCVFENIGNNIYGLEMGSTISDCSFRDSRAYASYAMLAYGSDLIISNCNYTGRNMGFLFFRTKATIRDSVFVPTKLSYTTWYHNFTDSEVEFENCYFSGNAGLSLFDINRVEEGHDYLSLKFCTIVDGTIRDDFNQADHPVSIINLRTDYGVAYTIDISNCLFGNIMSWLIIGNWDIVDEEFTFNNSLFSGRTEKMLGNFTSNIESFNMMPGSSGNIDAAPEFQEKVVGTWTSLPIEDEVEITTTFIDSDSNFTPDEHVGKLLIFDRGYVHRGIILSNTETSVTVDGLSGKAVSKGDEEYEIVDYHLTEYSSAIDAGLDDGAPDHDLDGILRPQGNHVDIGAYEFTGGDNDGDGIGNYYEVNWYGTDPNNADTDGDGLSDWDEIFSFATNPLSGDSDDDGQNDFDEVHVHFTNPLETDTDGDGFGDFEEIYLFGTDPNNALDFPKAVYVKPSATGAGNGASWANATGSIQSAIDSVGAGVAIWVARGVYNETITLKSGVKIYGGFAGGEFELEHRRPSENSTVIDASGLNTSAVLMYGTTNAVLDGFTITGGNNFHGGGVYVRNANASNRIVNCLITGNTTTYHGGGLSIIDSAPYLINCVIANNHAGQNGGAIYLNEGNPVLANCTVSGNTSGSIGGGLFVHASNPVLTNSILHGHAKHAIYEYDAASDATLVRCLFNANTGGDYFDYGSGSLSGAAALNALSSVSGTLSGAPSFVDAPNGDFHIRANSVAKNTGTSNNVFVPGEDFDGDARPFGGAIDVGADEWSDLDGDGIRDYLDADDDGDGLSDLDEINLYGTDPRNADSDGDGVSDGQEIAAGADPNDDTIVPTEVWVDFAWNGNELGTASAPCKNITTALNVLRDGGKIHINGASSTKTSTWTGRITTPITIHSNGGTITIGN